jgi:hypothetical protein
MLCRKTAKLIAAFPSTVSKLLQSFLAYKNPAETGTTIRKLVWNATYANVSGIFNIDGEIRLRCGNNAGRGCMTMPH